MITAWRLTETRWAESAFTGEGASRAGGRWNSPGVAVVYTSESQALALLEQLVHFDNDTLPRPYVVIRVGIPDELIEEVSLDDMPARWRQPTAAGPLWSRAFGDLWVRENRTVALRVPSSVVPEERNVVLNPIHPDFPGITIGNPRPFELDPRLFYHLPGDAL